LSLMRVGTLRFAHPTLAFTYDPSGRLVQYNKGATTAQYYYNGLGQRVKKTSGATSSFFNYDLSGQLIGEYNPSGIAKQEIIYLGAMPVATVNYAGTYYIHADWRNTPRQIDNASKQPVWAWDPQAFGDNLPNQNPSALGTFTFNLRFPGQYYDAESGKSYNYFRDYDSSTGRYLESDPIGLRGGVNTYLYANANPVSFIDPYGLCACDVPLLPPGVSIDQNIRQAQMMTGMGFIGPGIGFAELVMPGGAWDYNGVNNQFPQYEAGGNFNYGATGRAMGFDASTLLTAAGVVQLITGPRSLSNGLPGVGSNGDFPEDQENIQAGINYFNNCYGK